MKRLTMLLGFLCGILAVLFLLLKNPLAATGNDAGFASAAYRWTALEFAGNPFTPVRVLGVPAGLIPGSVAAEEFDYGNASILLLQDEQGQPVALATRLSGVGKGGSLLQGNAGIDTYTNIFWPNRGSVLMYGYENRWPVIASQALAMLGQSADGQQPGNYMVSANPPNGASAGIVGGSGLMMAVGGTYQEQLLQLDGESEQPAGIYSGAISVQLTTR